jgi:kumamolisin
LWYCSSGTYGVGIFRINQLIAAIIGYFRAASEVKNGALYQWSSISTQKKGGEHLSVLGTSMPQFEQFTVLPGSTRRVHFGHLTKVLDKTQNIEITMQVRRRQALDALSLTAKRSFLTRLELEEEYGASPKDLSVVLAFADHFGLEVTDLDAGKRLVSLRGSTAAMLGAFKVQVFESQNKGVSVRSRLGPIFIPLELQDIVTGVFGLDNRPQAISHLRFSSSRALTLKPDAFDGSQLASIYNFPAGDGKGQTIALIELGGGYLNSDIAKYFAALHLPRPTVNAVPVNGGNNNPFVDTGADTEVALDIQIAGAVVPMADIVVYFAPNDDQSFLKAILAAIHDEISKPTILSISWGAAESVWTEQQMLAMNQAFQSAAALGISIFCAAGDDGAIDNIYDGKVHVDFPASSPFVTACGGTTLNISNSIREEMVWNNGDSGATGGGISGFFSMPEYQQGVPMPSNLATNFQGRGLPDVAAVADPNTGYAVLVHGQWSIVGGTSAVAPLYAGLLARINARVPKPAGFINPAVYQAKDGSKFNDIVSGNNSLDQVQGYTSSAGWDAVTGWGTPNGTSLLQLFLNSPGPTSNELPKSA